MRLGKLKLPRYITTLLMAAVVATIAVSIWPPERGSALFLSPLHYIEWMGYDSLFALRPYNPTTIDPRICIVGYSTETENALKHRWPPPRDIQAKIVNQLIADGAALIAFDVAFQDPTSRASDKAFDKALANSPQKVLLTCTFNRDETVTNGMSLPMKRLVGAFWDNEVDFEQNAIFGFGEVTRNRTESTGKHVRSCIPVIYKQDWDEPDTKGDWVPSLPAAAYLAMTGQSTADIKVDSSAVHLGKLRVPRTAPTLIDTFDNSEIPAAYLDFPSASPPIISYQRVFRNDLSPGVFKNKVVFIGVTGTELSKITNEQFTTAATRFAPYPDRKTSQIAGIEVQTQILNCFLGNHFIFQLGVWQFWLIVFLYALAAIFVVRQFMNWRGPVLLVVVILAFIGISIGAFNLLHTHIPWVLPSILVMLTAATLAWMERGSLKKKWAGYVSPAVMQMIMQHEGELGARRYEATVMFGDIRNFTGFSEKHTPETVVRLLNIHLEKLTKHIYDVGGTIDKFLGDGILAVFGAPLPEPNSAVNAVRAAWRMREAALIPIVDDDGTEYTLATGFGITTGPLVAGHVGSQRRHEFTIIGDTVNLASRLQGVTGKPDVIIDMPTYELVRDHVDIEPLGEVTLKGKSQPIACVKVTAWSDEPKLSPDKEIIV